MGVDWFKVPHRIDDEAFKITAPTIPECYRVVLSKAMAYAVAFVVLWAFIVFIIRLAGGGAMINGTRRGSWALKSAMLVHHVIITPLAMVAMWEDNTVYTMFTCFGCSSVAPLMNRSPQPSYAARALIPVTIGYFIGDLMLLSQWSLTKGSMVENGLMLFHHITSILVWPATIYFEWVSRYTLIMLSYEFTSIWLTIIWMLSAAGKKKSVVYIICGGIFTLSFVLLRMVGAIPQLIALWHSTPWKREVEVAAAGPNGIHDWCWIFSLSLVAPHFLNLFWGVKVVKGFYAAVAGGGKKKTKD